MQYRCSECGESHEGFPALAFSSPYYYNTLPPALKENIAQLTPDFCIIQHHDQIDRFIRVVMIQKIKEACQDLEYGVWVSLSEKSFTDYMENFNREAHEASYFGWLANQLPEYEDTLSVKTTVITQKGNARPVIEINENNDYENPFVKDYFEGITLAEAQARVNNLMARFN